MAGDTQGSGSDGGDASPHANDGARCADDTSARDGARCAHGTPADAHGTRDARARAEAWIHADETRTRLIAFALRFLGDRQEAEDVVQETLLRAGAGFARLRSGARLEAWLFRICRHASIDRVRARQVRRAIWSQLPECVEPELPTPTVPEAPTPLPPGSLGGMLAHHRLLLRLHYERGVSQARLCALSGLSPPALRVRLYRARQALRAVVKPGGAAGR